MKTLPRTLHGAGDPFLSTQWSVILAAAETQAAPELAGAALGQLCQTYWPPLYTFVRHRGSSPHDAQDLTQSFFAYLIEHKLYARADRRMGKFRSFLLASLKHFLSDARDREQTLKRGGGHELLPLSEAQVEATESMFQTHSAVQESPNEDRVFERAWAETLVAGALDRLAESYSAEGRKHLFEDLSIFLTGGANPLPAYAELEERLGIPASTLRSDVTRLRARYREAVRAEVRRTVETEGDVEGELRELLRVLTERSQGELDGRELRKDTPGQ